MTTTHFDIKELNLVLLTGIIWECKLYLTNFIHVLRLPDMCVHNALMRVENVNVLACITTEMLHMFFQSDRVFA